MLESVSLIGEVVSSETDMIAGLVQDLQRPTKTDSFYIVKLNFVEHEAPKIKLTFDIAEIPEETAQRRNFLAVWRWVGNASGNNPQLFLTTTNLEYLVGPAIPNLLQVLMEMGKEQTPLTNKLQFIFQKAFRSLPDGNHVLDLSCLNDCTDPFPTEETVKNTKNTKKLWQTVAQKVLEEATKQTHLKKKEIGLWTVLFNGEPLVKLPPYDQVILRYKLAAFETGEVVRGTCSICGTPEKEVSPSAFNRLDFLKQYITDKIGFASGVSKNGFAYNFLVCKDCFQSLLLAERYVRQNLNIRVGDLNFLLLPAFLIPPETESLKQELPFLIQKLSSRVQTLTSVATWLEEISGRRGIEEELQDYLEELPGENQALLNFLFYQKAQSELRVLEFIKDVAPSRIYQLLRKSYKIARMAEKCLGEGIKEWWLDFTRLYRLIPLRVGNKVEHKKILYLYKSLLRGEKIEYKFLIQQFITLAHIYYTGQFEGTNQQLRSTGFEEVILARKLLQAGLLLKLLQDEKLLKGVKELPQVVSLEAFPELKEYLTTMNYSEPQTALFLLGYLLSEISRGQYSAGHEKKPILDKINYQGMSWSRVQQLANLLFEKLRQYDRLHYNELLYAEMKRLLDQYRENWPIGPEENVFYILSGYAFGVLTGRKKNKEE